MKLYHEGLPAVTNGDESGDVRRGVWAVIARTDQESTTAGDRDKGAFPDDLARFGVVSALFIFEVVGTTIDMPADGLSKGPFAPEGAPDTPPAPVSGP
jgi:hypothetical protein